MSAKPMFAQGGTCVLDETNKRIGFLFVEPLGDPQNSQLQRWILRATSKHYRFLPWNPTLTFAAWKAMVTTKAPDDGEGWGADPSKGLWVKDALYAVAQSTPVTPVKGALPAPTFPRRAAVAAHKPHGLMGPTKIAAKPQGKHVQIIVGDYVLSQLDVLRGRCFGDLVVEDHKDQQFYESSEYALLLQQYLGAGDLAIGGGNPDPKASITSLDPGGLNYISATQFHEYATAHYTEGSRYEVTGCNYYQSKGEPPGADLAWFL
ncbi:MAG: hypothetical protein QM820_54840 [Minicystis sp.]